MVAGGLMADDPAREAYEPDAALLRAFENSFLRAHGPIPPVASCPIGWQPSALTPVFYGVRDFGTADGAPLAVRIFFPSLDGDVFTASMLKGCGRYPVIVFCHGDCHPDSGDHYKKWFTLPAQLARSGYVVMVPQLRDISTHPSGDQGTQQALVDALTWIRDTWEHRDALMPSPATGIAGHSFGGLHAGILATKVPAQAVAYLSGVWVDWPSGPRPIEVLQLPQLFTWGTAPAVPEPDAMLPDSFWQQLARPRHRAVFANGQHWDYLFNEQTPCDSSRGPCGRVGWAAMDLVTTFFANYLPPELWPNLPDRVPDDLRPPPLALTPEQEFYAGGHLVGLDLFEADSACSVEIREDLLTDRTVPFVRFTPRNVADADVRAQDLVPQFTGLGGAGVAWVDTQSPQGGRVVPAGSVVHMTLRTGPIP